MNKYKWEYKTVKLEPDWKKARSHLHWLAYNLQANGNVVFLIERMQRNLLDSWFDKLIYALLIGLFFGLLGGIIVGAIILTNMYIQTKNSTIAGLVSLIVSVFFAFFLGLWACLTIGRSDLIDPVETLNLSTKKIVKSIIGAIAIGCITWSILSIACLLIYNQLFPMPLEVNLIIAVFLVVIWEISGPNLQKTTRPNEGTWRSLKHALSFAYVGGIGLALCAFVMKGKIYIFLHSLGFNPTTTPSFIDAFVIDISCILAGLFLGLTQAGAAFIQHFSLRIVLAKNGLPWDFARFLNYCVERRLLLRVGGSYRFLHRELLDHFAQSNH